MMSDDCLKRVIDIVLYDNQTNLGLVLQILPDFLRVLTSSNEAVNVKFQAISKKVFMR